MDKKNILIVDDSNYSRKLIAEMLETEDSYEIVGEASNAIEALNSLKNNKIHIMMIDVVMPGMSGLELAAKVHRFNKSISIIMISSLGGENIIVDAINSGASDFLQKPITSDVLKSSLDKVCANMSLEE